MTPFNYVRPQTLADATRALTADPDARLIAGGMTLIPTLKQGLADAGTLVDLAAIDELYGVRVVNDTVVIGAMTRHHDVATSPIVRERLRGVAYLAEVIGDPQVRNRGTIGGSVANNDPAADYPAALLAIGADIVTDRRRISADAFFTGLFETALQPGEIVTEVVFPACRSTAYIKFANPVSGYALCGVFAAKRDDGVRIAVTGAGPVVFRATAIEQAVAGGASARTVTWPADGLINDLHASAAYRANLIAVLAARAVEALA